MNKKLVLAYSGGLDTSYCVKSLSAAGYEVHGDQGTEHVHGAMGEVDDLQQTEDNREAKA